MKSLALTLAALLALVSVAQATGTNSSKDQAPVVDTTTTTTTEVSSSEEAAQLPKEESNPAKK